MAQRQDRPRSRTDGGTSERRSSSRATSARSSSGGAQRRSSSSSSSTRPASSSTRRDRPAYDAGDQDERRARTPRDGAQDARRTPPTHGGADASRRTRAGGQDARRRPDGRRGGPRGGFSLQALLDVLRSTNLRQVVTLLVLIAVVVALFAGVRSCSSSGGGDADGAGSTEAVEAATEADDGEDAEDTDAEDADADAESAEADDAQAEDTDAEQTAASAYSSDVEEALATCTAWDSPSTADFSDIAQDEEATGVVGFSLSGDEAPALSIANIVALSEALSPYVQADVPYGFIVMDLETGRGFACNLDSEVYGASSFKAALCTYLGQNVIDTGDYSLESTVTNLAESTSGSYVSSGVATISSLIENAIVYSSNASYLSLRNTVDDDDLAAWLEGIDADSDIAYDTSFPHYTARDAARMWLTIYEYWDEGTETASLIAQSCADTETSFLRDALEGTGVEVRDKAGWNADGDSDDGVDYNAIVDNGIVTCNGRDYLVCVMLGATYADSTVERAETLMKVVFDLHEDLA